MESLSMKLKNAKGKLLVAQGKRNSDDYTLVLGEIAYPPEIPKYVNDVWKEEKMVPVYSPKKPRVHCVPVQRKIWINKVLRELGLTHYESDIHYLTYSLHRNVDENIIDPKYGFHLMQLALVYLKDGQGVMETLPIHLVKKPDIYKNDTKFRDLTLTHFFN